MNNRKPSVTDEQPTEKVDLRKVPKDARQEPTTGQSATKFHLAYDKMNPMEKFVAFNIFAADQDPVSISYLADKLCERDPEEWIARAKLLVRNSLRRLVAGCWIVKMAPGMYSVTERCSAFFEGNYHLAGEHASGDTP